MKFQFKIQPYQTEAVKSVADVFDGQPRDDRFAYRIDLVSRATARQVNQFSSCWLVASSF